MKIKYNFYLRHFFCTHEISNTVRDKNKKKTYTDDRHLIEDMLNGFHYVDRHFHSTPEKVQTNNVLKNFSHVICCFFSPKNSGLQQATVQEMLTFNLTEQPNFAKDRPMFAKMLNMICLNRLNVQSSQEILKNELFFFILVD